VTENYHRQIFMKGFLRFLKSSVMASRRTRDTREDLEGEGSGETIPAERKDSV